MDIGFIKHIGIDFQSFEAGFYEGEVADKIVAEMERGKGIIHHHIRIWTVSLYDDHAVYTAAYHGSMGNQCLYDEYAQIQV